MASDAKPKSKTLGKPRHPLHSSTGPNLFNKLSRRALQIRICTSGPEPAQTLHFLMENAVQIPSPRSPRGAGTKNKIKIVLKNSWVAL